MLIDLTRCTYARVPLRRGSFNKGTTQLGGGRATRPARRMRPGRKSRPTGGRGRRKEREREREREEGRARAVEHEDSSGRQYGVYVKRHSAWWCLLNPYLTQLYRVVGSRAFFRRHAEYFSPAPPVLLGNPLAAAEIRRCARPRVFSLPPRACVHMRTRRVRSPMFAQRSCSPPWYSVETFAGRPLCRACS
jgi:hypothetical protein